MGTKKVRHTTHLIAVVETITFGLPGLCRKFGETSTLVGTSEPFILLSSSQPF